MRYSWCRNSGSSKYFKLDGHELVVSTIDPRTLRTIALARTADIKDWTVDVKE